jgi:hypothetical protein
MEGDRGKAAWKIISDQMHGWWGYWLLGKILRWKKEFS